MKFLVFVLLAPATVLGGAVADNLSPVTRVVELLKSLAEKVESEMKKEEDMFETYQCWANTVIDTKTAQNVKSQSRIDSLDQYISDLESGRIELTTERVDLTKEISELSEDMEQAEAIRTKEKEDYEAAKAEMETAIKALSEAVGVLDEGTAESFLQNKKGARSEGKSASSLKALMAESDGLAKAVDFGKRFLSKGDALFLQRLLTADVPTWDWKKLNRKADFKMKYEARSGKIMKTLKELLATFEANLEEVEDKEAKAVEDYDKLMAAKGEMKEKAQAALESMEVEGAARGLTVGEAKDEVAALTKQIENDEGFIKETTEALEAKKTEHKDRKQVRVDEQKAISEAISILYNDDARDNFKKSFASQGYMLVQLSARRALAPRRSAAKAIRDAGAKTGDSRLLTLAARVAKEGEAEKIKKVIELIDEMITTLKDEEASDLEIKEKCEEDRAEDARKAVTTAREMDEMSDEIAKLLSEIEELKVQIEEKKEAIKKLEEELEEATRIREDEHAAWEVSDKEDEIAIETVASATEVLEKFYAGIQLQKIRRQDPPLSEQIKAGEAPPPPPPTWTEGETDVKSASEGTGIISILKLVEEDITKDKKDAEAAEEKAEKEYQAFKKETESAIATLEEDISTLEGEIGEKEGEISTLEEERLTAKGELEVVVKKMKEAEPGCDFATINFDTRVKMRQLEVDGLEKAKAILEGAEFP